MTDSISVLLLTSSEQTSSLVVERLERLDCRVSHEPPRRAAMMVESDLIVLDLRSEASPSEDLIDRVLADERPLVLLAEEPTAEVRRLADRSAGTMLMTGAEDDSGYRVALQVSRGLHARRRRAERRGPRRGRPAMAGPLGVATASLGA